MKNREIIDFCKLLKKDFPTSLVSMAALGREMIQDLFRIAAYLEATNPGEVRKLCENKVIATLFYQPSTRTRLNFEAGIQRLGANVIGFSDPKTTRAGDFYQESLEDVIRFTSEICDLIVLRHYTTGASLVAEKNSLVPVINAGDGYNQHPTQALGDIYTMAKCLGSFEEKCIGYIGDLNVRSLKSITYGLVTLGVRKFCFMLPAGGTVPDELLNLFRVHNVNYRIVMNVCEMIGECHLIETIGINHPNHNLGRDDREATGFDFDERIVITRDKLDRCSNKPYILHPGPRTNEISVDCDLLPQSKYFEQARNGMWIRMAIMATLLC